MPESPVVPGLPAFANGVSLRRTPTDRAGYLKTSTGHVYCVREIAEGRCRGAVLLCGPLGSERAYSYNVWVRWARFLASHGFDVLRFDYSGTGESAAVAPLSWQGWLQDAQTAGQLLNNLAQGRPMFVHGLRFGALVARHVFAGGDGDVELLWDPPPSGEAIFDQMMRRQAAEQAALRIPSALALGGPGNGMQPVGLDGLSLTRRAWAELASVRLPELRHNDGRPHKTVWLEVGRARRTVTSVHDDVVRVPAPPFWRPSRMLMPPLDVLFDESLRWICAQLPE